MPCLLQCPLPHGSAGAFSGQLVVWLRLPSVIRGPLMGLGGLLHIVLGRATQHSAPEGYLPAPSLPSRFGPDLAVFGRCVP